MVLFCSPLGIFFILKKPWLNFRNLIPSVLGFAIVCDTVLTMIFKDKIKYLAIILTVYLCICNVSEVMDYHKTAISDFKIIEEISKSYNGKNNLFYEIKTDKYLEQNSPYHDHIISVIGTDWGLTGCCRAVLKNRNIKVYSNN